MSDAGGPSPPCVIVAGFHRSGTSFAASVLHRAGLSLGDDLIGAMPSNPLGHYEDRAIVSFHNALLDDNGASWQTTSALLPVVTQHRWMQMRALVEERSGAGRPWGFKDPRVSLFLSLWTHVVPHARVLIVYRPWWESVASLHRRHADGLERRVGDQAAHQRFLDEPDLGHRLWITYNEALLRFAAHHPKQVAVVGFKALSAGFPLADALESRWHLGLRRVAISDVFEPAAVTADEGSQQLADEALASQLDELLVHLDSLSIADATGAHTP